MKNKAPMVRLGDYIEECDKRNGDLVLKLDDIKGISTGKGFIETKADMNGVSLAGYKIVAPREFAYVSDTSRRGDKVALAFNSRSKSILISSIYSVFRSKNETKLLPEYLFLLFNRTEFDRYARFNSWGSARETFDFSELCRTEIPLPSLDTQRELVAIYDGLKKIVAENEALIKPLEEACRAFVVECKQKYRSERLGNYIEQRREKNDGYDVQSRGVTKDGFITPKQEDADTSLYNVFYKNDFVFNPARMELNSIALNTEFEKAICSSLYEIFYIKDTSQLLPEYLNLFVKRDEFARFCWFDAIGSARNYFRVANMQDIKIPIPPIDVQKSIISMAQCLRVAKKIIQETRARMKNLCPALVQKAVHSA